MQKITPFLWFDTEAEEAIQFYTSIFDNAKLLSSSPGPDGSLMTGTFQLEGCQFMALNAGPQFTFTPAISFLVACDSVQKVDRLWEKLSQGGNVLMPLDNYGFSEKYGWCDDKYGVSWQISLGESAQKITPSLLFVGKQHGRAEEAMQLYTSIFDNSQIETIARYEKGENGAEGTVKYGSFWLDGQAFMAMDSNLDHQFTFSEATSLFVSCQMQEEVDYFWNKLIADGGEESMCGWLKDKFGVWWQIIPDRLGELLSDSDPARAQRATQAMLQMRKIIVADLETAANKG